MIRERYGQSDTVKLTVADMLKVGGMLLAQAAVVVGVYVQISTEVAILKTQLSALQVNVSELGERLTRDIDNLEDRSRALNPGGG